MCFVRQCDSVGRVSCVCWECGKWVVVVMSSMVRGRVVCAVTD